MKKFILLLAICTGFVLPGFAGEALLMDQKELTQIQNHINEVGFKILNANEIDKHIIFFYTTPKTVNAYTDYFDRHIEIARGMYMMLEDEDQLAAILSHEISHAIDSYDGPLRGYFSFLGSLCAPKKYEYKSDKRAVDYMVNAGYHPVAAIVIMNKTTGQYRFDWNSSHPLTSRRMMEVYEYIYKKYPEYLVNNKYKTNIYYQNFLLTSKQNRAKLQKKVEEKSKGRVHYL